MELMNGAAENYHQSWWKRHGVVLDGEIGALCVKHGNYDLTAKSYTKVCALYAGEGWQDLLVEVLPNLAVCQKILNDQAGYLSSCVQLLSLDNGLFSIKERQLFSDGLTDSLQGLSGVEMSSVVDWRKFYFERYTFVGKLVGWYYDKDGNPTKHLKGIEAKAKRAARLQEKQKIEEAKIPSCNSKWSQQEGGEVWCDAGYPRLVQRPLEMALNGKRSRRCACFKEEELGQPGLEVYKNCDFLSKSCVV
ncbi:hypothetical protein M5K25_005178 [Dendrobium thyrsiflorum]|uniref:Uncharacterized protein n=1 Tax=Dendrobium thyrsiflorum TaxID=117978 RepID=A0ABD0VI78_DENTH